MLDVQVHQFTPESNTAKCRVDNEVAKLCLFAAVHQGQEANNLTLVLAYPGTTSRCRQPFIKFMEADGHIRFEVKPVIIFFFVEFAVHVDHIAKVARGELGANEDVFKKYEGFHGGNFVNRGVNRSMKILALSLLFVSIVCTAVAQDDKDEKQSDNTVKAVGFTSAFLISTDFKAMYFNMVGGQIRYSNGDFALSIAIMPTLRFRKDPHLDPDDDLRPFVTPGFSVGLLLTQKRFMLGFPVSYSYDSRWHPTIGMGYKFGNL